MKKLVVLLAVASFCFCAFADVAKPVVTPAAKPAVVSVKKVKKVKKAKAVKVEAKAVAVTPAPVKK